MNYSDIISINNLNEAWKEFIRGKKHKKDVANFNLNLASNIYDLHQDLKNKTYTHSTYHAFNISDPKPRNIHKASVRDRLLHHAVYRILYPYFDKRFIFDSYSCRLNKGTHRAMERFKRFGRKVGKNHTRTVWVLKCDIKKFFASIDHDVLKQILKVSTCDVDTLWLLSRVIDSFNPGLPLGNLTSQLLVNIYMNEFDQYVKHKLKVKHYVRYADDFVVLYSSKPYLEDLIPQISTFLNTNLKLSLHPDKVFIKTFSSGVDFLGWVHFPDHRVLRTSTKRRMIKKINEENRESYMGLLRHGNTKKLMKMIG